MSEVSQVTIIEFPTSDLEASKTFFTSLFGWKFEDQAPFYTEFSGVGFMGAFHMSGSPPADSGSAALMVFYSKDLEASLDQAEKAGGIVVKPIFSFPGGRRFHIKEPGGNEVSIWTDLGLESD